MGEALSDDTSFETFLINGIEANDGDSIPLPYGSTRVNSKIVLTDPNATYGIVGDGKATPLVAGDNEYVLTVTAANGESATYTVTLTVQTVSTDATLAEENPLTVNGEAVDLELLDNPTGYVDLPLTATKVSISANAQNNFSDVFVNDKTVLPNRPRLFSVEKGVNEVKIQVIPEAGVEFQKTYTLKIYVGGSDATIKSAKVNTSNITFNNDNEATLASPLANGTKTATLFIEPNIALATLSQPGTVIEFDGGDATVTKAAAANTYNVAGLVTGDNPIAITITPGNPNSEAVTYSVNIPVAPSSDKTLKSFKVNGLVVAVGSTQILAKGTTSVELDAETTNEFATFEVSGGDELVPGLNTLTVTVTAEDGGTADYKVTAIVIRVVESIVVPFNKAGASAVDAKANKAGNAILAAEVKKIGKGTVVKVNLASNFLIAKEPAKNGPARAKSITTFLKAQKFLGAKTAIYTPLVLPKNTKGVTVTFYYY